MAVGIIVLPRKQLPSSEGSVLDILNEGVIQMMDEAYERRICKGRNVQPYPFLELKDKLPRLPVPPLQETAKKYLNYLQPLLTPEELRHTAGLVEEFVQGDGPNLQEELIRLDKESPSSWLEGWWDTGYLEFRVPCPINVNPFFVLRNDPSRPSQVHNFLNLVKIFPSF